MEFKHVESLKKEVLDNGGNPMPKYSEKAKEQRQGFIKDVQNVGRSYKALKSPTSNKPAAIITIGEYLKELYGFDGTPAQSFNKYLTALGIDTARDNIASFTNTPELNAVGNWIIPEIIIDAVRLGIEQNVYRELISTEKSVSSNNITVPHFNVSDSASKHTGETERFSLGSISMGSKNVGVRKVGKGINISYEARMYSTIDLLALELADIGRLMAVEENAYIINTLINGEQAGNTESAPVIGTADGSTFTYKDLLRISTRMSNLQRIPQYMISREDEAIDIALISEIKGFSGDTKLLNINRRTADVRALNSITHGIMPANKVMFVDPTSALVKLVVNDLMIEEDKDIMSQVYEVAVSQIFGLYKLKRDAAVILDRSVAFSGNAFPAYMDLATYQNKTF